LVRVKYYFAKIREIANPDAAKRSLVVDKEAAGRIIKHGLVRLFHFLHVFYPSISRSGLTGSLQTGNDQIEQERAARQGIETSSPHIESEDSSNKRSADEMSMVETSASTPKRTKTTKKKTDKRERVKLESKETKNDSIVEMDLT
jgi:hypothetical protein